MLSEADDDGLIKNSIASEDTTGRRPKRKRTRKPKSDDTTSWLWSAVTSADTSLPDKPAGGWTCVICQKNFVSRSNLQIHSNIHSGERFKCDQCTKSFTQKCNLKRHEKIHLGQKSFPCSLCSKNFTQKANLQRHFAMHSGKREFSCDTCGKKFGQKGNLKKHMDRHVEDFPLVECVLDEDSS